MSEYKKSEITFKYKNWNNFKYKNYPKSNANYSQLDLANTVPFLALELILLIYSYHNLDLGFKRSSDYSKRYLNRKSDLDFNTLQAGCSGAPRAPQICVGSKIYLYVVLKYRVFIKCCFFEDFKIFQNLAFLCFPSVSVCVHTRQVEKIF